MPGVLLFYWTSVEFDILDPSQYDDCIGGFVYLFYQAKDVLQAIPIIEKDLKNEGLSVTEIEFISEYDEIPCFLKKSSNDTDE